MGFTVNLIFIAQLYFWKSTDVSRYQCALHFYCRKFAILEGDGMHRSSLILSRIPIPTRGKDKNRTIANRKTSYVMMNLCYIMSPPIQLYYSGTFGNLFLNIKMQDKEFINRVRVK